MWPVLESYRRLVKTFVPFLISPRYKSPIFTFHGLVTTRIVIAGLFVQISHHHWGGTTGAAVDDSDNVCPHLCMADAAVLSTLSHDLWDTWREEQQVACLWVAGLQCVPGVFVQSFPRLGKRARGRLFWKRLVETRFACCRLHFVPAANGSYRAASLRHCSRPDSRLAPRITPNASPSVLEIEKCRNSWSVFSTRQSLDGSTRRSSASFFSAFFIACFSPECNRPTKSLAKYDQVLQLGPVFFPSLSGIRLFSSTTRIRDLVSI